MKQLEFIKKICENEFNCKIDSTRTREVVGVKCAYSYLANKYTSASIQDIAEYIHQDRTTIFNQINNVFEVYMLNELNYETRISNIEKLINQYDLDENVKIDNVKSNYHLAKKMLEKWNKILNENKKLASDLDIDLA